MRATLRSERIKAGLTALEIAQRAGMQEMRVFSLERGRGRVHPDEAKRLADALGTTTGNLFPGEQIGGAQ